MEKTQITIDAFEVVEAFGAWRDGEPFAMDATLAQLISALAAHALLAGIEYRRLGGDPYSDDYDEEPALVLVTVGGRGE